MKLNAFSRDLGWPALFPGADRSIVDRIFTSVE
jgi:hypothetical protein